MPDASVTAARVFSARVQKRWPLPLFGSYVPAGFPSPADGHEEGPLDLNELVIRNPASTFFLRARGDSMTGAGIHDGALLVVDRSLEARSGDVVIAALGGELTVKRLLRQEDRLLLVAENDAYAPVEVDVELHIWGVVTHALSEVE